MVSLKNSTSSAEIRAIWTEGGFAFEFLWKLTRNLSSLKTSG